MSTLVLEPALKLTITRFIGYSLLQIGDKGRSVPSAVVLSVSKARLRRVGGAILSSQSLVHKSEFLSFFLSPDLSNAVEGAKRK